MKDYPTIYRQTIAQAKANGDMELYRASHKENIACSKAIDEAIRNNFDGMHLNDSTADGVIQEYGIDRVIYVLANTLQQKEYDGRFSAVNKEWAAKTEIPDGKNNYEFCSDAHPAVLDGFCDMVRKAQRELQKPSIKKKLAEFSEMKQNTQSTHTVPQRDKGAR